MRRLVKKASQVEAIEKELAMLTGTVDIQGSDFSIILQQGSKTSSPYHSSTLQLTLPCGRTKQKAPSPPGNCFNLFLARPAFPLLCLFSEEIFYPTIEAAAEYVLRHLVSNDAVSHSVTLRLCQRLDQILPLQLRLFVALRLAPLKQIELSAPEKCPDSPCTTRETLLAGLCPLPSCIFVHAILIS